MGSCICGANNGKNETGEGNRTLVTPRVADGGPTSGNIRYIVVRQVLKWQQNWQQTGNRVATHWTGRTTDHGPRTIGPPVSCWRGRTYAVRAASVARCLDGMAARPPEGGRSGRPHPILAREIGAPGNFTVSIQVHNFLEGPTYSYFNVGGWRNAPRAGVGRHHSRQPQQFEPSRAFGLVGELMPR